MGLIKIVAKVSLMSQDDMEMMEINERQGVDTPIVWKWRSTAIRTEDIMRIVGYSKTMSLIITYNTDHLLVDECFKSLYERWEKAVFEEQGIPVEEVQGEEVEHPTEENDEEGED